MTLAEEIRACAESPSGPLITRSTVALWIEPAEALEQSRAYFLEQCASLDEAIGPVWKAHVESRHGGDVYTDPCACPEWEAGRVIMASETSRKVREYIKRLEAVATAARGVRAVDTRYDCADDGLWNELWCLDDALAALEEVTPSDPPGTAEI